MFALIIIPSFLSGDLQRAELVVLHVFLKYSESRQPTEIMAPCCCTCRDLIHLQRHTQRYLQLWFGLLYANSEKTKFLRIFNHF